MNKCLSNLDSRADKQRFLEANHAAFMIPKKFDAATYQNKVDEVSASFYFIPRRFVVSLAPFHARRSGYHSDDFLFLLRSSGWFRADDGSPGAWRIWIALSPVAQTPDLAEGRIGGGVEDVRDGRKFVDGNDFSQRLWRDDGIHRRRINWRWQVSTVNGSFETTRSRAAQITSRNRRLLSQRMYSSKNF